MVAPTVSLTSDAALASQVTYDVGFTTTAHGGLAARYGTITLVAPQGTVFPSYNPDYIGDGRVDQATSPDLGQPGRGRPGDRSSASRSERRWPPATGPS